MPVPARIRPHTPAPSFLRRRLLALGAALPALAACSPLSLINRAAAGDSFSLRAGIPYADGARSALDLYLPARPKPGAPALVFFYGGNWSSGARADYLFAGEALASLGYVTAIPDYRLYPEVRFPDFLHDCARAVAWVLRDAALGAHGVVLAGHSAGAYNAAMLALEPGYLRAAGADHARVRALLGLAGPYDFLPLTGAVARAVFGFPDTPPATQPIHHASAEAPPALLLSSKYDEIVDPGNSARLAARLRALGRPVEERDYAGLGHAGLVGALARPLRSFTTVRDDIAAYLDRIPAGNVSGKTI